MKAAITGLRIRASISLRAKMLILLKSAAIFSSFSKKDVSPQRAQRTQRKNQNIKR
jgi:hypothetical protein